MYPNFPLFFRQLLSTMCQAVSQPLKRPAGQWSLIFTAREKASKMERHRGGTHTQGDLDDQQLRDA